MNKTPLLLFRRGVAMLFIAGVRFVQPRKGLCVTSPIDALVYELYGLTDEEIGIVEGK